jgi:DNA-binding MarR family transcriptional regulator
MSVTPDDATVALWVRLMRASSAVLSGIEVRLKAAGLPPLEWYDVLLELDRAGADGLRPMMLEARLLLPQYGVSRLLKRLADEGLVQTRPALDDRRGTVVAITAAGRAMRRRMWPVYAAALEDLVAARITPEDRAPLTALLARLG